MGGSLKSVASKYLKVGSVWKAVVTFGDESKKLKYVIVLAVARDILVCVLPTSKGGFFQKARGRSFVHWPAGTCDLFQYDTWVSCDGLKVWPMNHFDQLVDAKKIKYIGRLADDLLEGIYNAVRKSKAVSRREKALIFPGEY